LQIYIFKKFWFLQAGESLSLNQGFSVASSLSDIWIIIPERLLRKKGLINL